MIAQKEKITSKLILNYGNMPEDIMKVDKTFFQTCSSFSTNSVHGCFASGIPLVITRFQRSKIYAHYQKLILGSSGISSPPRPIDLKVLKCFL